MDMGTDAYKHQVWLLGYDLRSEHGDKLTDAQKAFLGRMRGHIWHELRYTYKCAPLQHSLWLIRDKDTYEKLEVQVQTWLKEYETNGFSGTIQVFPSRTTDEGRKVFQNWELNFLMEWLASVEESCERLNEKQSFAKKDLGALRDKVDLIETIMTEDFGKSHDRWQEMSHQLQIASDRINELRSRANT